MAEKKVQKKDVPFFARFLEDQEFPCIKSEIKSGHKGGPPHEHTMKYPSDGDET